VTELYGGVGLGKTRTPRGRSSDVRPVEDAYLLAAIVESSDDAIVSKDLNTIITSWNRGAERLFGYTAEEAIGRSVIMLIPEDRLDEEPMILAKIQRGERIEHYETVRRRKDGSLVDVSLTTSPIKDAQGRVIGASKIARDITDRRRLEQRQRLLLGEMKHRIKNTLATVQAVVAQTLHSISKEEQSAFEGRLGALARAHDLLTTESWDVAPIRDAVCGALEPFEDQSDPRFEIDGPDQVKLDADTSLMLAMVLHELATNAVKYGALSAPGGRVQVAWSAPDGAPPGHIQLVWRESGGPRVSQPTHKGFGARLVERAFKGGSRAARFDYAPDGLVCTLEIAL
jgi:PAS domain S-box-containing protein